MKGVTSASSWWRNLTDWGRKLIQLLQMNEKSRGDLCMPSPKLQDFLRNAELVFTKSHAHTLSLEKNPITWVSSILE